MFGDKSSSSSDEGEDLTESGKLIPCHFLRNTQYLVHGFWPNF